MDFDKPLPSAGKPTGSLGIPVEEAFSTFKDGVSIQIRADSSDRERLFVICNVGNPTNGIQLKMTRLMETLSLSGTPRQVETHTSEW